eukprot:289288-Rhodomonas_salina.1
MGHSKHYHGTCKASTWDIASINTASTWDITSTNMGHVHKLDMGHVKLTLVGSLQRHTAQVSPHIALYLSLPSRLVAPYALSVPDISYQRRRQMLCQYCASHISYTALEQGRWYRRDMA